MIRRAVLLATVVLALTAPAARADFGFAPGSMTVESLGKDGTRDYRAGSHPYSFKIHVDLKTSGGKSEGGQMRDLIFDLPPGLIGDPLAIPRCSHQSFEGLLGAACSPSTQVGIVQADTGFTVLNLPLFNLDPSPGQAAQFGFSGSEFVGTPGAFLRSEEGLPNEADERYGVRVAATNLPIEVIGVTVTIWGEPADESHRPERGNLGGEPTDSPPLAFFTLPTSCANKPVITAYGDSDDDPGVYAKESSAIRSEGGTAASLVGCESIPFAPTTLTDFSANAADSPSGLGFQLKLPNHGLLEPRTIAETEPVKTVVDLPQGVTANPAAATGLGACTEQQFQAATLTNTGCPDSSKLGTLFASSPLLEEPIEGSVYLADPGVNRFGSLVALYIVATAPERGVLIKQAGRVDIDQQTGQLTASFDGLPPVPYSNFEVRLREGPRAPLITPQGCGTYTTIADLYPYSAPGSPMVEEVPFAVTSGAPGGSCVGGENSAPNTPSLEAGAVSPVAGAYSPFVLKLSRADGTQRFSSVVAEPPLGLAAKLAGIPYCPQSGITQAATRTAEGDGEIEQLTPSCPASSQVGSVTASAGAGPSPYVTGGKIYLAGPYRGAPLSFEVIAPAIAGPFDLGVVASRVAVYVNEETAKIKAISDPLPTMLHGIPLDLRSVSVRLDRSQFSINPTNCETTTVTGSLTSLTGSIAPLSQRFQVGGCKGLKFEPTLSLQLKGATKRTGHPAVKAVISFPAGAEEAHTQSIQVGLPRSLFLDQGSLNKVCKQADLRAGTCPSGSVYGKVKAWTPLFENPLQGNVFLGVGFGYKLPALVTDLNGQVRILAHGRVDTTKQKGLRNTFEFVPDAPLSRVVLELKGGKKYGLIENSENLCAAAQTASARFVAHSGQVAQLQPRIKVQCKKHKKQRR
jgi:hypothetical protein